MFARIFAIVTAVAGCALADFRFIHITDTHFMPSDRHDRNVANRELLAQINELSPAFVINTGDVVEYGHSTEYAHARQAAALLTMPQYYVPGNHDVRWNPLGKAGFVQGVDQPLRQHWHHEGVHFILMDSTVLLEHHGHLSRDQLDWLGQTLGTIGTDAPVVIGFHHWIGRDRILIDNEREFLETIAPYNVLLLLQGHGHSDLLWNVNGTWAVMQRGLYQGSFMVVDVDADSMKLSRWKRVEVKADDGSTRSDLKADDMIDIPLVRDRRRLDARVELNGTTLRLSAEPIEGTTLAYRIGGGGMTPVDGSSVAIDVSALGSGLHRIETRATAPDGRAWIDHDDVQIGPLPLWTTQLDGAVQSQLLIRDDTLFVSTMGGSIYAIDPNDGSVRWRVTTDDSVYSSPEVVDGVVYAGSADQHVYAIDAGTGSIKWKTRTDGAVLAGAAVAKGVVGIGSADTKVYGLRVEDGSIAWTVDAGNLFQSKAATDGERFYVGGWDNHVRSIDASTGTELWKRELGRKQTVLPDFSAFSPAITSPRVVDGLLYISTNDGTFHALNTRDGSTAWSINRERMGYSTSAVEAGVAYVVLSDQSFAHALNAKTGEVQWQVSTAGAVYDSGVALGADTVHVGLVEGVLLTVDRASGEEIRRQRIDSGFLFATPVVWRDRVMVSTMTGRLVALPVR